MPIYEYKCDRCNAVFEVRQKFADEPLTVHEECGGPVHRLLSAPALQFKGSGWYITDYARAGSSGSKSESKSDSAKGEAKESSKESKSESKTDSNGSTSTPSTPAKSESKSDSSTK